MSSPPSKKRSAFMKWYDTFNKSPGPNPSPNRFAFELPNHKIHRDCLAEQILAIRDQFMANNPTGRFTFNYKGFKCFIVFNNTNFNGYIQTTLEQRKWFEQNRHTLEQYEPHGGITCESALNGTPGFGFDCAHYGDLQIDPTNLISQLAENPYGWQYPFKTPEFVDAELRNWADHLVSILPADLAAVSN